MKLNLTGNVVANWIEATVTEIKELLIAKNIPYKNSWARDDTRDTKAPLYTHQIKFPWCQGDVVVGTLHSFDMDIIHGDKELSYPSIETSGFPWDYDSITVFDTPKEFAEELERYYKSVKESKKFVVHDNIWNEEKKKMYVMLEKI